MNKLGKTAPRVVLGAFFGVVLGAASAQAAEGIKIPHQDWSFDGIFGLFERPQLQRGLQVYQEVCAGCHGLKYIAFRNLSDLGYTRGRPGRRWGDVRARRTAVGLLPLAVCE
jgi:cytochrome c1